MAAARSEGSFDKVNMHTTLADEEKKSADGDAGDNFVPPAASTVSKHTHPNADVSAKDSVEQEISTDILCHASLELHPQSVSSLVHHPAPPTKEQQTTKDNRMQCHRQIIDFHKVPCAELNCNAFQFKNPAGEMPRASEHGVECAESRARQKIVRSIHESGDNDDQHALALFGAVKTPEIHSIAKSAGFLNEDMQINRFIVGQAREFLMKSSAGGHKKHNNNEQRAVLDAVVAALSPNSKQVDIPSKSAIAQHLGYKGSSANKKIAKGTES